MFLVNLPHEVLLDIADSLDKSQDLLTLACVNRTMNDLFLPYLYKFNVRQQCSSALLWGVQKGKASFVERMLRNHRADVNTTDRKFRTPVFHAIRAGNETICRILLSDERALIDWQDKQKQTPLVYALQKGCLSMASFLLNDFKPSVDIKDKKRRTAIWCAIARCDENLVRCLLERNSDIRTPDYKGISLLGIAIDKESVAITRMLLLHSNLDPEKPLITDLDARDHPLWLAAGAGLRHIIQLLVAYGADPSFRGRHGQSLLHRAAKGGYEEAVRQLLTYEEISVNATDSKYRTALHIAAEDGHLEVAKSLLAMHDINVNATDSYGRTAPHIAAEYGYNSFTKMLLAYDTVDINASDGDGATALCLAAHANHTAIALQILCEDHVHVNAIGKMGRTTLHNAVRNGNQPITCALLNHAELDPNVCDDDGWASLTYAAFNGDLCMVELFLARADIQVNAQKAPPLFHAAKKGHLEIVRRLLRFDTIDINQKFWNNSPICIASEMGHLEVARLLLAQGARLDINSKTYLGYTALSLAAFHGHLDIIDLLLEDSRLDVAAADEFGETALCQAARNGHEQIVKHLYRDLRAKGGSDVGRAIEVASHCRIAFFLQGHLKMVNGALGLKLDMKVDRLFFF